MPHPCASTGAFAASPLEQSLLLQEMLHDATQLYSSNLGTLSHARKRVNLFTVLHEANEPAKNELPLIVSSRSGFPVHASKWAFSDEHDLTQDVTRLRRKWGNSGCDITHQGSLLHWRNQNGLATSCRKPEHVDPRRNIPISISQAFYPCLHSLGADCASKLLEGRNTRCLKRISKREVLVPCSDGPFYPIPLVKSLVRGGNQTFLESDQHVYGFERRVWRNSQIYEVMPICSGATRYAVDQNHCPIKFAKCFLGCWP